MKVQVNGNVHLTWRRFRRNPRAEIGGILVLLFIIVAVFSDQIAPYDPRVQDLYSNLDGPSWSHPFGKDEFGRDIFSRIIHGTRISLAIGLGATAISTVLGVLLGLASGYFGGWVGTVIMRAMDVMLAFPGLLLALAIVHILGPGLVNVVVAVGLFAVPTFARVVRGSVLQIRQLDFVTAARAQGAGNGRILVVHILSNAAAPIIVLATVRMATAILTAAGLSFLGLGAQPPTPEWGAMLSAGREFLRSAPHVATFPGIAIMLLVLAFNMFGDGLQDALDPRGR